jgi:hypothetical protein
VLARTSRNCKRQRERPTPTNLKLSDNNKDLVVRPRWVLYSKTEGRLTIGRNIRLRLRLRLNLWSWTWWDLAPRKTDWRRTANRKPLVLEWGSGTSSTDWVQLSKFHLKAEIQSRPQNVFFMITIKIRWWIMFRIIILLIYNRHKLIDLIENLCLTLRVEYKCKAHERREPLIFFFFGKWSKLNKRRKSTNTRINSESKNILTSLKL